MSTRVQRLTSGFDFQRQWLRELQLSGRARYPPHLSLDRAAAQKDMDCVKLAGDGREVQGFKWTLLSCSVFSIVNFELLWKLAQQKEKLEKISMDLKSYLCFKQSKTS